MALFSRTCILITCFKIDFVEHGRYLCDSSRVLSTSLQRSSRRVSGRVALTGVVFQPHEPYFSQLNYGGAWKNPTRSTTERVANSIVGEPERWVDEHCDRLYRYALVRVCVPEVAGDLVQETLLAAVRSQRNSADALWSEAASSAS